MPVYKYVKPFFSSAKWFHLLLLHNSKSILRKTFYCKFATKSIIQDPIYRNISASEYSKELVIAHNQVGENKGREEQWLFNLMT